jgi:hypothetical protein
MSDAARRAAQLQAEMRAVRSAADVDVQTIVDRAKTLTERAKTLTDWHYYVRNYPLWCTAGAVAVGFLLVPRLRKAVPFDAALLHKLLSAKQLSPEAKQAAAGPFAGLVASLATMAARSLLHRGMEAISEHLKRNVQSGPGQSGPQTGRGNGRRSAAS